MLALDELATNIDELRCEHILTHPEFAAMLCHPTATEHGYHCRAKLHHTHTHDR
jgi:hypothetical protein